MDNSVFLEKAKKNIKNGWSIDDLIRKFISLSDSVEKSENVLFEQVYDVYFLYYPEAASLIKERDAFINLINKGIERNFIADYFKISKDSMGFDLNDNELQVLSMSVNELNNLSDLKKIVDEKLYQLVSNNYPTFTAILGPEIASRMIYLAGKAKSLAFIPASKLQVLGAEKAMFSSRKRKATPKYGIIFNHEFLARANKDNKGKVAKIISSYASLAIKIDIFSNENKGNELREKMVKEISEIEKNGTKKIN